ncbi:NAD(P)-binding domain-containing protein [Rhodopirellula halodulae]|uniref:NAD(P)-binding domain-containing protein n=1 Tax=Rhodopirellula halodulae TaxID=2894198 RepID=UPI001E424F58|nr:NAD(P)-binding domain-containing protein [Rhodopirellula sp. JC737]MCC9658440.1 NAD(P)-binding domain-containing protein [Rhodopirellula sp. JC737]
MKPSAQIEAESHEPNRVCDVVIVGGGPIGIETAIEMRRHGIDAQVFEAGPLGHTISWWAPQTRWFSSNDRIAIAGVPLYTVDQAKASREEYLTYLRSVVDLFQVPVQTFSKVQTIESRPDDPRRWQVQVQSNWIEASAVVLAIGGTDHAAKLKVPGENLPHVDGYLREVHQYHNRRVLIVGGRNSAVEAAIRLHRVGAKVTLSYRGEELPTASIKYWLRPEIDGLIRSKAIETLFQSRVTQITAERVDLEQTLPDGRTHSLHMPFDDVLTLIGYDQDKTLFKQLGIQMEDPGDKPVFNEETMETERPGIYVAGTAVGGTQSSKYQVFLENCHVHAKKITRHLLDGGLGKSDAELKPEKKQSAPKSLSKQIEMNPES